MPEIRPWLIPREHRKLLEMRAFLNQLRILILVAAPSLSVLGSDLGQLERREDFQNSVRSFEAGEPLPPKDDFRFTAEWIKLQMIKEKDIEPPLGDVSTHLLGIRYILSDRFLEWRLLIRSFQTLLSEMIHRPIDALRAWMEILYRSLPALLISILMICFFQLLIWRASIMNDLQRLLKISTNLGGLFLLTGVFIAGVLTKQILFIVFVFCMMAMLYSRNRGFYRHLSLLFLFIFLTAGFWRSLHDNLGYSSLKEAMNSGKNRLEYPEHLLAKLKPEDQAQWAFWNHQYLLATSLNQNAFPSLNSSLMKLVIEAQYQPARLITDQLKQIEAQYGKNEVVSFNLSQLYLKSQSLDLFDKVKTDLGLKAYSKLYNRSLATSAGILPPKVDAKLGATFYQASLDFFHVFTQLWGSTGLLSFLIQISFIFLPLFVFFIFLFLSRRTSGLCQETGQATPSHDEFLSTTTSKLLDRRDALHLSERKQWKTAQLFHKEQLIRRIRFWIWFIPGAYQLEQGSYRKALALNLCIYLIFWSGLSSRWRSETLFFCGFQEFSQFISFGASINLFILGFILLILNALWGIKKVSSA